MSEFLRTNSSNKDFIALVKHLDAELAVLDGEEHAFYAQFNSIESLNHVILAIENGIPVACGALKALDEKSVEIKRMYTIKTHRAKGFASGVLQKLEIWALELGFTDCVLETGLRQKDAIHLYLKNGYRQIENYGQYLGIENSRCFAKHLV